MVPLGETNGSDKILLTENSLMYRLGAVDSKSNLGVDLLRNGKVVFYGTSGIGEEAFV